MTLHVDPKAIRGAGGGGSKKGSNSSTANTLRGRAKARLLYLISEGQVEGLKNGEQGIYFGQTPLKNADGTYNFPNVQVQEHVGLADEGYFTGQDAVETTFPVDTQVKITPGPVVRTIVEENTDAVRVIGHLPALLKRDDATGEIQNTSVSYAFDVRPAGGSWTQVVLAEVNNQKTTSVYPFAHRIELPLGGAPWDLRMRRITADSTDDNLQNDTFWDSYVTLVEGKFTYPHSAMVALEINAEDMGGDMPEVAFAQGGILCQVPTNYDPETRVYTGIWNGTFKRAKTSNPAWIFYDLIVNDRYGLGEFIPVALVDKWSLYSIAQYCDQLVASGYKDENDDPIMEPRFTFNGVLNRREEAFFVLQQITTAWRGMAFWSLGQVFATADMPADPAYVVSRANIIGHFNYPGTALKARHSVAVVSWNDPNDFYRPATEVVIDDVALRKFGWREKPVQLQGCTSRGLAHRYGKWVLDTEQNETETVEYSASLDHIEARPGQVIAVADPLRAAVRLGGRIVSHVGNQVTLDQAFAPAPGESYNLMLIMPDGSLEQRAITNFAGAILTVAAFSQTALTNAMFAITGTDVTPRLYRIVTMAETEPHIFKITALAHDPNKYARVEQNVEFDPLPYTRTDNVAYPPVNLDVIESGYTLNGTTRTKLTFSWTPDTRVLATGYRISVETPSDGYILLGETRENSIDLSDVEEGTYTFHISAISYGGIVSPEATIEKDALGPTGIPLPTITNLRLTDRPGQSTFVGRDVQLSWTNNFASSIDPAASGSTPAAGVSPQYAFNTLVVKEKVSGTLLRTQQVTGTSFVYTFDMNKADSLAAGLTKASRSLRFELTLSDVYERTTAAQIFEVSNPLPALPSVTVVVVGQTARISWPQTGDTDIAGTKVWVETGSSFTPDSTTPKFDSLGSTFSFTGFADTTYYVRVGSYDAFSSTGLNVSAAQSFTLGSFVGEINDDFAEIPGYLFGEGDGTLYDQFQLVYSRLDELAAALVDTGATGHVQRLEITASLGTLEASFLEQITVVVDDLAAVTSRVTTLEATVADGSVVAGVVADLEALTTEVEAQATALTEVGAQVGDITAGARWAMQAIVAPSGVTARFAMMVRVTDADTYIESGILIDIITVSPGVYTSRIALKTDQLVVTDGVNTANALTFEGGVLKILAARMGRIDSPDGVSYIDLGPAPAIHLESA